MKSVSASSTESSEHPASNAVDADGNIKKVNYDAYKKLTENDITGKVDNKYIILLWPNFLRCCKA